MICRDYRTVFGQRRAFLGFEMGTFENIKRLYQAISITLPSATSQIETIYIYIYIYSVKTATEYIYIYILLKLQQKEVLLIKECLNC